MTSLSNEILAKWQVRKTPKQKDDFIAFLRSQIPELRVEEGGFGKNKNLVVGDVASARVICTAHYDTCARLPFPNFLAPKNIPANLGYALLLCIPLVAVMVVIRMLLGLLDISYILLDNIPYLFSMTALLWLSLGGPPNPNTVNDNTSGVITLCELMAALSPEERSQVAFVFVDNEENGLFGSRYFARLHKKESLQDKLVMNFDCVSDGEHIMLVQNRAARKAFGATLAESFVSTPEHKVHLESAATTMYPSDQASFPTNVGIAAFKHKKGIGLYIDRIHTKKDTVLRESNITYLVESTKTFLEKVNPN